MMYSKKQQRFDCEPHIKIQNTGRSRSHTLDQYQNTLSLDHTITVYSGKYDPQTIDHLKMPP